LNIKIIALLPNTTSKLQPLDAGIIAAFKCHYHQRQLEYALNQLNEKKDPYKINQLTAMKWATQAWHEVKPSTIVNCWRHTSILPSTNPVPPTPLTEQFLEPQFQVNIAQMIQDLHVKNPMPINDFLNPIEEVISNHMFKLTNDELLEGAETIEEEEEEREKEEEVVYSLNEYLSLTEKVEVFARVIAVFEADPNWENERNEMVIQQLRRRQGELCCENDAEKRAKFQQTSISMFLS